MEKNTANNTERRFSLNMTQQMPDPIAESTCVNLNGNSSASQQQHAHFQWGGTPISPKNRSSSSDCLSSPNSRHFTRYCNVSEATSPTRLGNRANISRIDPRIYADVQSTGLASRIVKYHQNGATLNRSMSASNLYSKPGQFPIVHLQKSPLPAFKTTNQRLSMTRIAPPEKSMFAGSTLSSLLRSNSIVGLQKTDEEISRENRPILHPPATERELAPTRSVLEVLKEISRKRINSDELALNDATKKYCSRDGNTDIIDGAYYQQGASNNTPTTLLSNKRQREQQQHNQKTLPATSSVAASGNSSANLTNNSSSSSKSPQPQTSPEQIAKRRHLSSYNNDITSSLSSSRSNWATKRKLHQRQPHEITFEAQHSNPKVQRSEQLERTITSADSGTTPTSTPITPIPATPLSQTASAPAYAAAPLIGARTNVQHAVTPARTPSCPVPRATVATKPRITLFNKNYDVAVEGIAYAQTAIVENGNADSLTATGDCAGIQFVKPKKYAALGPTGTRNPLIERTQRSKLALMLSSLRGELYQGDSDTDQGEKGANERDSVDAGKKSSSEINGMPAPVVTAPMESVSFFNNSSNSKTELNASANIDCSATTTPIGISSPASTALLETPLATAAPASSVATSTISPPVATNSATTPAAPTAIGGFKFTPAVAQTPPSTVGTAAAVAKKTSPLVGLKLTPQTPQAPIFGGTVGVMSSASVAPASMAVPQLMGFSIAKPAATVTTTPSSVGGLNFCATPPAVVSVAAVTTTQSSIPQFGGFSFGTITKQTTSTTVTAASGSVGSGLSFNAGGTATATDPATNTSVAAEPVLGGFAFSAAPTTKTAATEGPATTTATTMNNTGGFKFGVAGSNLSSSFAFGQLGSVSAPAPVPAFGVKSTTTAAPTALTTSAPTALTTSATKAKSTVAAPAAASPAVSFSFGGSAPKAAFSFGGAPASPASVPNSTVTPAQFSFRAAVAAETPATTTATTNLSSTFGGVKAPAGAQNAFSLFATAAPKPADAKSASVFGNLSGPDTNNSNTNNTVPPTASAPLFSFGSATSKPLGTSVFGAKEAPSTTTTASASTTTAFSFGRAAPTAASSANIFGGAASAVNAASQHTGGFSFADSSATIPTGSTFGTLAGSSSSSAAKTFSFVANSGNNASPSNTTTTAGTNIFGNARSNPPSLFGGGDGGTSGYNSNNASAISTFSFTAAAAASPACNSAPMPAATALSKPTFNFGSGGGIGIGGNAVASQPPATNVFGSVATPGTAAALPSFSFGGVTAAKSAGPASSDRPIRRATRRLQKS